MLAAFLGASSTGYSVLKDTFVTLQKARTLPFPYVVKWENERKSSPALVIIGDSRASLWPEALRRDLAKETYNYGVGGSTSYMWLQQIANLPLHAGDRVIIQLGINDIHYLADNDPDADYIYHNLKANLAGIIEAIKLQQAVPILMAIIAPGEPGLIRQFVTPDTLSQNVAQVNRELSTLAEKKNILFINANAVLREDDDPNRLAHHYQADDFFLHLNCQGYMALSRYVSDTLKTINGISEN